MSVLKTLQFTAAPNKRASTPEHARRNKIVAHMREQLAMVKAELEGKRHVVLKRHWAITDDGVKHQLEVEKRLKRWWETTEDGVVLVIRWANKPIEFEKGKSAIAVNDVASLPDLLQKLILAAANGELDNHITSINNKRKATRAKAA